MEIVPYKQHQCSIDTLVSFTEEEWVELPFIGFMEAEDEKHSLELRNCRCGSTLAVEMPMPLEVLRGVFAELREQARNPRPSGPVQCCATCGHKLDEGNNNARCPDGVVRAMCLRCRKTMAENNRHGHWPVLKVSADWRPGDQRMRTVQYRPVRVLITTIGAEPRARG